MTTTQPTTCCWTMGDKITQQCVQHPDSNCPDIIMRRLDYGTYIIPIHDGGSSGIAIDYCPWCGTPL